MKVLQERIATRFAIKHPDCRNWIAHWIATVQLADWQTIHDVKAAYPSTDGGVKVSSGLIVTVFDVGGNKYRLIARLNYAQQAVTVLELLTHADYSKQHWKRRHWPCPPP